ncbi:ectonucleoside triphosphate diphosphohydrolase 8-like isoform X2 [Dendrobates tinctorius]|uniref:ectonucleoside triphosphate diphosphohydrolase 8-like isoform X2 n=1 Tax=Dendrobates tinctorius TaxID=92724 RepID=UPI003CCA26AC
MCRNRKGLAVGCLICISIVSGIIALILSVVGTRNIYQPSPNKYGLVFDAGSSHTSLYLYQWPAHKENDTGIVSQIHMCEVHGSGLSSYADNPSQAGEILKPCMDEVLKIIPSKQHRETTTLLGATAGMRLLKLQNETKTQQIFHEVSKTLREYPVNFQGARILDGKEEGSLGWVTVNYLLGTFIQYSYIQSWFRPKQAQMVGAMDLGGASTQMTFQPSGTIEDKSTEMIFKLYGYDYTIYTHSYLCYGQDQALKKLLVHLIETRGSGNVQHPCYPRGYTTTVSLSSVYDSPCVTTPSGNEEVNVTVVGTGDSYQCLLSVSQIFNFSVCGNSSCSFNGIYQPPVYGEFYAFSAFYYTFNFLNLTCGQSLSETNSSIWGYCSREWTERLRTQVLYSALNRAEQCTRATTGSKEEDITARRWEAPDWTVTPIGPKPDPDRPWLSSSFPLENQRRLVNYCSSAMYILTLLLNGYKFTSETWNNIHFAKQAGNADVGWTLGYMLNLTNMIPSEEPSLFKAHEYNMWVAAIFFIVLSLAAALVAAPLHCFCRNACAEQAWWT